MASIARPTRTGVISDGVLTEDGNPFNLKYAVLTAQPGDVLDDVTTPNYVVGDALYRTGLVVDADQRGLGVAWPAEANTTSQGRAKVRASGESAAVIHATVGPGPNWFTISGVSYERETMDRIRAAIINGGYDWPTGRITVTVETVTGRPWAACTTSPSPPQSSARPDTTAPTPWPTSRSSANSASTAEFGPWPTSTTPSAPPSPTAARPRSSRTTT